MHAALESEYKISIVLNLRMFFKNGATPASFSFIFVFSNKHYNSYNKLMWKMSIQYPAPGLELTTSWLQVSSLNH